MEELCFDGETFSVCFFTHFIVSLFQTRIYYGILCFSRAYRENFIYYASIVNCNVDKKKLHISRISLNREIRHKLILKCPLPPLSSEQGRVTLGINVKYAVQY